jgi:hypothetical protein
VWADGAPPRAGAVSEVTAKVCWSPRDQRWTRSPGRTPSRLANGPSPWVRESTCAATRLLPNGSPSWSHRSTSRPPGCRRVRREPVVPGADRADGEPQGRWAADASSAAAGPPSPRAGPPGREAPRPPRPPERARAGGRVPCGAAGRTRDAEQRRECAAGTFSAWRRSTRARLPPPAGRCPPRSAERRPTWCPDGADDHVHRAVLRVADGVHRRDRARLQRHVERTQDRLAGDPGGQQRDHVVARGQVALGELAVGDVGEERSGRRRRRRRAPWSRCARAAPAPCRLRSDPRPSG